MTYEAEPENLVRSLVASVNGANLDWEKSSLWTKCIKDCLYDLLKCEATDVLLTSSERKLSEFLLDIVAWNRDNGEGIILAVECEWLLSPFEIVKDFEKLLVVKSALKLMIFASSGTKKSQEKILGALSHSFMSYKHHIKGERYIFIDFAKPPLRAAYWLEIPIDGRLDVIPPRNIIALD